LSSAGPRAQGTGHGRQQRPGEAGPGCRWRPGVDHL